MRSKMLQFSNCSAFQHPERSAALLRLRFAPLTRSVRGAQSKDAAWAVTQFILFAAGALLLAACHKFQATTEVRPDGSGELRTEVGFTAEERQSLESQSGGADAKNFCNAPLSSVPPSEVTEAQRGDETWCVTTWKFDSLDELRRLYEEKKGIRINRLEFADGKFYYDIDVDTASKTSDFSAFKAITWTVTMPGTPIYYNAAQVEGNTLTWNPPPQSGTVNLRAESPAAQPDSALPLLIGGVIVLTLCVGALLGGGGAFFLMRRSRRPSSTKSSPVA